MLDGSLINEIQICEGLPLLLVDLKVNVNDTGNIP